MQNYAQEDRLQTLILDGRKIRAETSEGAILMKKLIRSIFAVLFLFAAQGISAEEIQKGHSGSWWNSSQNGHGFSIEVFDDNVMVIYWYVFNPDGTSTFLVTVAAITGDSAP